MGIKSSETVDKVAKEAIDMLSEITSKLSYTDYFPDTSRNRSEYKY